MLRKLINKTVAVFALGVLLTGCESLPKNVGMSESGAEIGMVYKARLKAIYPIFVRPDIDNSASDGVGVLAEALTERAFGLRSSSSRLSAAASDFARAATGMYEERYAGLFCHYILEVDNENLVSSIGGGRSGYDNERREEGYEEGYEEAYEDDMDERDEDEDEDNESDADDERERRIELRNRKRRQQSRRSNVRRQVDRRVESRMGDLWGRLEKTLGEWQGVTNIDRNNGSAKSSDVFVVNPCRNFSVGSMVTISKGGQTIILQPSY